MNMRIDVEICTPEEDEEWALKDRQLNAPKFQVVNKEWSGSQDGLPPVSMKCEYRSGYAEVPAKYSECEIIAHFTGESGETLAAFIYKAHDGVVQLGRGAPSLFRPLRTLEQRAEEDRQVAISEIVNAIGWVHSCPGARDAAERVYEAGFRKTEGVEIERGDV